MQTRSSERRTAGLKGRFEWSLRDRRCVVVAGVLAAVLVLGSIPARSETHRDPKAVSVLQDLHRTIAPGGGWSDVPVLRFTFTVVKDDKTAAEVHHLWDVRSGDYRVQWKGADGTEKLVILNVGTKAGKAWMKAPGASAWTMAPVDMLPKMVETGYGRFINDTYWLLMPLKTDDPGVNVAYDGEQRMDGAIYDVVKLTFDHVGLTPGDTYWVFVNRATHLIDRWQYILEGEAEKAEAKDKGPERTTWIWKKWETFGPIRLATEKRMVGENVQIQLKDVEVLPAAPAGTFDPPAAEQAAK